MFANFIVIVLRVEIVTIFEPKVVTISARNTIMRKVIFSAAKTYVKNDGIYRMSQKRLYHSN